ncbi:MAG: hypothetical protein M0R70_15400 [Nitrospirae bacterium]|nr:hypothetical protein [Nitrospirota bacterium]
MKSILILLTVILVGLPAHAQELRPLPDMSSAHVPTAHDAEAIVLKKLIADPKEGLSATESIVGKLSFSLGTAFPPFGKKGDRVWQVHRLSFAETTSIVWVNAETKAVLILYPQKKEKVEQTPSGIVLTTAPAEASDQMNLSLRHGRSGHGSTGQ